MTVALNKMITLDQLFIGANLFVLPFWAIMIILPNWDGTKRIMSSFIPFTILALLYVGLFFGAVDPESAEAFANLDLTTIAATFSQKSIAVTSWVHFLVMDLFIGRWIYWEGQRTQVWTLHSLLLSLFAGPMGLLSHILTAAITEYRRDKQSQSSADSEVSSTQA